MRDRRRGCILPKKSCVCVLGEKLAVFSEANALRRLHFQPSICGLFNVQSSLFPFSFLFYFWCGRCDSSKYLHLRRHIIQSSLPREIKMCAKSPEASQRVRFPLHGHQPGMTLRLRRRYGRQNAQRPTASLLRSEQYSMCVPSLATRDGVPSHRWSRADRRERVYKLCFIGC